MTSDEKSLMRFPKTVNTSHHYQLNFRKKLKIEICINMDLSNLENIRATSFNKQSWMTLSGTDLTSLVALLLSFVVIFSLPHSFVS